MSIYLTGVTFPDGFVRPQEDAALMAAIAADGLYGGASISVSGASFRLSAGRVLACGRAMKIGSAVTAAVSGSSGYARLRLVINRARSAAEQVALEVDTASSLAGFAALTQEDINNGGSIYELALATASLAGGNLSLISTCGKAHGRAGGVQVILTASGWSGNQQTVRCDGATADNLIEACGAPGSLDNYRAADVRLVGQTDGKITFSCVSVPSVNLTVNVRLS